MVFHAISHNMKLAAIHLYKHGLVDFLDILEVCDMSSCTFYQILKLWQETGDVMKPLDKNKWGWPCLLDCEDIEYLVQLICQKPNYFLNELLHLLQTNHFVSIHFSVIHQELEHAGMSHKKLKSIAIERNEELQAEFIAHMAQ
ncbi:hypothetical protein PISMIDRAFT_116270 [Pisolithus microcarpus 441]|uniref:Uncharacterized protein n=1 Tax=Pisolithus microcarpus 441 TaxID=765257 RepID=A0A0C9Z4E8_9AGAM|nr:hypothetical protein PISMIDRAFT_116270 [Pisolithus microcarpus 441]